MKDIKGYIQERAAECEKRAESWESRVRAYTERMTLADSGEEIQELKFERQKCIGKKNELLAVADFCNDLLYHYFRNLA